MDAKDERSKSYELSPVSASPGHRKARTLAQAVNEYWKRVSDEVDSPLSHQAGGELL